MWPQTELVYTFPLRMERKMCELHFAWERIEEEKHSLLKGLSHFCIVSSDRYLVPIVLFYQGF